MMRPKPEFKFNIFNVYESVRRESVSLIVQLDKTMYILLYLLLSRKVTETGP
jgi:hypothetical protein